ncbi:hypothetical protein [Neorhizobium sp. JUb45]|uniref:hypothetical protein n=1 Tax=unclassified Neorhizobium TaxID=2629175 RepID=UPI00104E410F|nr:hypothetical protein [Neorhizobium sp. JUb45]
MDGSMAWAGFAVHPQFFGHREIGRRKSSRTCRETAASSGLTVVLLRLSQPNFLTGRPGIGMFCKTKYALHDLTIFKHPDDPPVVTLENLHPVARQYAKSQSPHQNMTNANFSGKESLPASSRD